MPLSFIFCSIIVPLMLRFIVSSIHYGMTLLACHWALTCLCQQEMYFCVSLLRSGCLLICWQSLGWHILLVCLAYPGYWILCRKDVFFALFFFLLHFSHSRLSTCTFHWEKIGIFSYETFNLWREDAACDSHLKTIFIHSETLIKDCWRNTLNSKTELISAFCF